MRPICLSLALSLFAVEVEASRIAHIPSFHRNVANGGLVPTPGTITPGIGCASGVLGFSNFTMYPANPWVGGARIASVWVAVDVTNLSTFPQHVSLGVWAGSKVQGQTSFAGSLATTQLPYPNYNVPLVAVGSTWESPTVTLVPGQSETMYLKAQCRAQSCGLSFVSSSSAATLTGDGAFDGAYQPACGAWDSASTSLVPPAACLVVDTTLKLHIKVEEDRGAVVAAIHSFPARCGGLLDTPTGFPSIEVNGGRAF